MQLDVYVECSKHISSGAYASNVECVHTSAPGHTTHYIEFILGIYTDIVISYLHIM